MKDEYDFSDSTRGKFHRPDARLIPPVHLEPEVLAYLAERAEARGVSLGALVREALIAMSSWPGSSRPSTRWRHRCDSGLASLAARP
jgi:hypothetical protein